VREERVGLVEDRLAKTWGRVADDAGDGAPDGVVCVECAEDALTKKD
jgi:hypothetical protein